MSRSIVEKFDFCPFKNKQINKKQHTKPTNETKLVNVLGAIILKSECACILIELVN